MRTDRIKGAVLAPALVLLGVLACSSAPSWASPADCSYTAAAGGSGMGGTGAIAEGSGMGGTGAPAQAEAGSARRAGSVIFSQGLAEAQGAGGTRRLAKGAAVCVGETIVTAQAAQVQIRMDDGGMLSVRPDTKVKIDEFRFDGKEDGTEKSVITLLQGGFRALTGLIGHTHKENYSIRTPFANIGIRGTDHEPMFIPNPGPGQTAAGVPGTYDKVNSGGVVIRNPEGSVEVRPDQVGFVPNDPATAPVLLKEMPRFYRPGGEAGEGGSQARGERGGEAGEHGRGSERGEGAEIHAPEPHSDEVKSPEVRVPEIRAPETPEPAGAED